MRGWIIVISVILLFTVNSQAKEVSLKVAAAEERESAYDKKMLDELKTLLQPSPLRVKVMPGTGVKDLFPRWTHAVCIGCDNPRKAPKVLHTYPFRILAGVLASSDDERERRGLPIPRTTSYLSSK